MSIKVHLRPDWFEAKERLLVDTGALQVFQFRYDSGVAALRLVNPKHFDARKLQQAEFSSNRNSRGKCDNVH